MKMTMEVRKVIHSARHDFLSSPEKWFGGQSPKRFGTYQMCLGYALGHAAGNLARLELAMHQLGFTTTTEIVAWNDAPDRTFADVRALLDKALAEEPA